MIRVMLVREIKRHGIWRYKVQGWPVEGVSSQPLLSACRKLQALDEACGGQEIGLYREGREKPDLVSKTVALGAKYEVKQDQFHKYARRR